MFIHTQHGRQLVNLKNIMEISVEDETDKIRELSPNIAGDFFAIWAVFEKSSCQEPIVLASYGNKEVALDVLCKIRDFLGLTEPVCCLFSDEEETPGPSDQEQELEQGEGV